MGLNYHCWELLRPFLCTLGQPNCQVWGHSPRRLPSLVTLSVSLECSQTFSFYNSQEGFTEFSKSCYINSYGLLQGKDADLEGLELAHARQALYHWASPLAPRDAYHNLPRPEKWRAGSKKGPNAGLCPSSSHGVIPFSWPQCMLCTQSIANQRSLPWALMLRIFTGAHAYLTAPALPRDQSYRVRTGMAWPKAQL